MKTLFILILLCLPFMAHAQNVGVGTETPAEFFSVGSSSPFRVNANGNLVRINNVQYNFPSVQATSGSVLANDGSGNLSWTKVTTGNISATGTANSTTFLRGDGSWQTPSGGSLPNLIFSGSIASIGLTNTYGTLTTATASQTGVYLITVHTTYTTTDDNTKLRLRQNSSTVIAEQFTYPTNSVPGGINLSIIANLTAGDTVELQGFGSFSATTITGGAWKIVQLQ